MTDKAAYILGRLHKTLEKQVASNQKYLELLQMKLERLESGGEWHEPQQSIEDIKRIMNYKLEAQSELLEILQMMCDSLGICNEPKEHDKLLEWIASKPALKEKLEKMMESQ